MQQQLVTTVHITDPDDPATNQCPCTFELLDPYNLFELDYKEADSYKAHIKTRLGLASNTFDRDAREKQLYKIKIKATDRGGLSTTTNVYVEVGDVDDNAPSSGGKMTFDVLSYNGKISDAELGRVLIVDDDRGLMHPYASHRLEPPSNAFSVNEMGVVSVTKEGVKQGRYKFDVVSTPKQSDRAAVRSSIVINVKDIPDNVVQNGFPLRLRGLRKHLTCREIENIDFVSILSRVLGVDSSRIIVFSVQETRSVYRGVDIWFAVSSSSKIGKRIEGGEHFMSYMELLMKISERKAEIEKEFGNIFCFFCFVTSVYSSLLHCSEVVT